MVSESMTQHKISIFRKLTATKPKTKSDIQRKTILKSRIKPYLESLDLFKISRQNLSMELKFVKRYGKVNKDDNELRKRYNIVENIGYSIVKIHKFGVDKRVIAIKTDRNENVIRFLDTEQVNKVFNVLIANSLADGEGIGNGVSVICDWLKL